MQFDSYCVDCLVRRQMGLIQSQPSGEQKLAYIKEAMQAMIDAPNTVGAPYMVWQFDQIFAKYWEPVDHYSEEKKNSNDFMLARLPKIRQQIRESCDPVFTALQFAQTANYIDFGALSHSVTEETLDELLLDAVNKPMDTATYKKFTKDLETAKKLVYLGDNAGEIVADMAFIETMQQAHPQVDITYVVRGGAVINDVTHEDATAVGMDKVATVMGNGMPIPGTEPTMISQELRDALDAADMVIAKGQGNFETFCPSPYNTYYVFLCKCDRFLKMFDVPPLTGMFCNESSLPKFEPLC
ncbi:MAG: ARMT1-like domain-containing protein [Eubacteriales bacterium]